MLWNCNFSRIDSISASWWAVVMSRSWADIKSLRRSHNSLGSNLDFRLGDDCDRGSRLFLGAGGGDDRFLIDLRVVGEVVTLSLPLRLWLWLWPWLWLLLSLSLLLSPLCMISLWWAETTDAAASSIGISALALAVWSGVESLHTTAEFSILSTRSLVCLSPPLSPNDCVNFLAINLRVSSKSLRAVVLFPFFFFSDMMMSVCVHANVLWLIV